MLQRGAPKLGKDGKPMKDKHGKVIYEPYRIKVLNTINFKKSMHYNPFAYHLIILAVAMINAASHILLTFQKFNASATSSNVSRTTWNSKFPIYLFSDI